MKLSRPLLVILKIVLFGLTAAALAVVDQLVLAVIFAAAFAVNLILLTLWGQ
jgi:hypothetical protein